MNIEQNKWITKILIFTYFVQYLFILLNIHLLFQYSLIHEWHKVKWITQNEIAKKIDIHFCSIFTYFQYSLIHDLALNNSKKEKIVNICDIWTDSITVTDICYYSFKKLKMYNLAKKM